VSVEIGQRWRSVGDGHVLEVVDRAPTGWHVRFDESGIMTIIDDAELLDPGLYENAAMREWIVRTAPTKCTRPRHPDAAIGWRGPRRFRVPTARARGASSTLDVRCDGLGQVGEYGGDLDTLAGEQLAGLAELVDRGRQQRSQRVRASGDSISCTVNTSRSSPGQNAVAKRVAGRGRGVRLAASIALGSKQSAVPFGPPQHETVRVVIPANPNGRALGAQLTGEVASWLCVLGFALRRAEAEDMPPTRPSPTAPSARSRAPGREIGCSWLARVVRCAHGSADPRQSVFGGTAVALGPPDPPQIGSSLSGRATGRCVSAAASHRLMNKRGAKPCDDATARRDSAPTRHPSHDLLVNGIGSYTGSHLLNVPDDESTTLLPG
jgi:hypothetical protein